MAAPADGDGADVEGAGVVAEPMPESDELDDEQPASHTPTDTTTATRASR